MALREFEDRHHVRWRVWDVRPETQFGSTERATHIEGFYPRGWLVFEAEESGEKRRLHPSPQAWEAMTDAELESLLERAVEALPRPWKPLRSFPYPGGGTWAVYPYYADTPGGGRVVLRFSSAGRHIDLQDWPLEWAAYSDDGLVTLLRGVRRTGARALSKQRRRWNDPH